jgi:hypothetical protein
LGYGECRWVEGLDQNGDKEDDNVKAKRNTGPHGKDNTTVGTTQRTKTQHHSTTLTQCNTTQHNKAQHSATQHKTTTQHNAPQRN